MGRSRASRRRQDSGGTSRQGALYMKEATARWHAHRGLVPALGTGTARLDVTLLARQLPSARNTHVYVSLCTIKSRPPLPPLPSGPFVCSLPYPRPRRAREQHASSVCAVPSQAPVLAGSCAGHPSRAICRCSGRLVGAGSGLDQVPYRRDPEKLGSSCHQAVTESASRLRCPAAGCRRALLCCRGTSSSPLQLLAGVLCHHRPIASGRQAGRRSVVLATPLHPSTSTLYSPVARRPGSRTLPMWAGCRGRAA